jgi:drug/metabolite transporter (DMT)-like permease
MLKGIESNVVASARVILMIVVMGLFATLWKKWKTVPPKELLLIAIAGVLNFGLYSYTFSKGLQETSATQGSIIFNTAPIFSMIFAVLFKLEKWSWPAFAGAVVAIGGVVISTVGGVQHGSGSIYGDVLVLLSAMLLSFSSVLVSDIGKKYHPAAFTSMLGFFGILALLPFSFMYIKSTPWASLSTNQYLMLAFIGVLGGALAYGAYYKCISQVGPSSALIYAFFTTPFTMIVSYIFLGQGVHPLQIIGAVVVLAGAGWSIYQRTKSNSAVVHPQQH